MTEPEVFLITNTHNDEKKYEKLDEFVEKMSRNKLHNESMKFIFIYNFLILTKFFFLL